MANEFARSLRKRMTLQEVKLWVKLRQLKSKGLHFRRQAPVGKYIVDFVCFHQKLIIEADGGQHNSMEHISKDLRRDAFLKSEGFLILRYWNSDIDCNLAGVVDTIVSCLNDPHPDRLTPVDPPHKGEG